LARRRRFGRRPDFAAEPNPRRGWLRVVLWSVLVLLPVLGFLGFGVLWLTVPPDNQTLRIPGLSAAVEITFDGNGVPRIRAANERDAATALGYVHARDRMFQMDLMRRATSGRLSELVGPATLPIDKQMRVLGLAHLAEADLAAQSPDTRALLEAYAQGVNAWISSRGRFAGMEYLFFGPPELWRPADSLLWGRYMGLWLSTNYRTELSRQALRDKVPSRLLEQLWPPHPAPPPPDARLTDDRVRFATVPSAEPGSRPFAEAASRRFFAGSDQGFAAPDGPVEPGHDGRAQTAAGPVSSMADAAVRLSAEAASALLSALPVFPAPFTLPSEASDAWAVDGRWTDTGAPLLAGDPHLSFDFPGLWYLVRIETPDRVLVGATGPGVPFLVMGRNDRIAWTFTTTSADTQDVYLEPSNVAVTTREERIKVRGQPDTILTVRETRHGPVISDLMPGNGPIMAVAMANLSPRDTAATGLLALNHARNVEEAGNAAALITSPVQNMMVADRAKIGLFVTGRVPLRRAGDGWAPVPGTSALAVSPSPSAVATPPSPSAQSSPVQPESDQRPAAQTTPARATAQSRSGQSPSGQTSLSQSPSGRSSSGQPALSQPPTGQPSSAQPSTGQPSSGADDDPYGWTGFASGEALPHIVAPASGRLVNANEPVAPPNFPVFMGRDTYSDWRARRIRTLLDSLPKHSTSDFAAMQVDVVSTYAAALLPMLRVVPGAPQVLRDWDGAMTENAPQPLIFSAWMNAFHHAVLAKAGIPVWASAPVFEFVPFVLSPNGASWCGGDCAPLLKSTLDSTMSSLIQRFGSDPADWRWGTVHQAVFAHPLLRSVPILGALTTERIAVPGDGTTLDQGGTNEALEAVHGASYRGVYDLADLDRSLFMMTPGQSGNPLSRHARDFLMRWRDGAMVLLAHDPVEVSGTVRLEP
jgi:acyl-homoserine lactone acylase PvdQ